MADTVVNELGIEVPRECQMTDYEEFGLKQRLDYIIVLNKDTNMASYRQF